MNGSTKYSNKVIKIMHFRTSSSLSNDNDNDNSRFEILEIPSQDPLNTFHKVFYLLYQAGP